MKIVDQIDSTPADQLYDGDISIKWRGNSTKYRAKHPYKIKLAEKTDLFGMGKGKHWTLLANDLDHTQIRNQITLDFANSIGMEYTSHSKLVTLYLNNEYQGVYELAEHVRVGESYVDIYDWKDTFGFEDDFGVCIPNSDGKIETETPQTGGFILEADFYRLRERLDGYDYSQDYLNDLIWQTDDQFTEYFQPFYFNSPVGVGVNTDLYQYTKNYIQAFEYALHSDDFTYHAEKTYMKPENISVEFDENDYAIWTYDEVPSDFHCQEYDGWHYTDFFDLDSLINYFFVVETTLNWDSMKNSTFIYKDIEGKAFMGPVWDYDWAYGNINIDVDYITDTWRLLDPFYIAGENECFFQTTQWYMYLLKDPAFIEAVYNCYHEIRDNQIQDLIDSVYYYDELLEYDCKKNDELWGGDRYTSSEIPEESFSQYTMLGYEEAYDFLEKFLEERITWLDKQFESIDTLTKSFNDIHYQNKFKQVRN